LLHLATPAISGSFIHLILTRGRRPHVALYACADGYLFHAQIIAAARLFALLWIVWLDRKAGQENGGNLERRGWWVAVCVVISNSSQWKNQEDECKNG